VPTPAGEPSPYATPYAGGLPRKDKVTAGLLALLLGGFGAHHWYLGNTGLAAAYLIVALSGFFFSFILIGWLWLWIPGTLALIEGIIYLTAPDDRFQRNYHNWFLSGP
jgi:TM2 domain-containing membrane protein YozV